MKLILDTHIFLWALSTPDRIAAEQRLKLESLANIVYVSSVSIAEIMIKASIGKLKIDFDPNEQLLKAGFEPLEFTGHDAQHLKTLPFHHRDPFDRMLISQSLARRIPIITRDAVFEQYECRLA